MLVTNILSLLYNVLNRHFSPGAKKSSFGSGGLILYYFMLIYERCASKGRLVFLYDASELETPRKSFAYQL